MANRVAYEVRDGHLDADLGTKGARLVKSKRPQLRRMIGLSLVVFLLLSYPTGRSSGTKYVAAPRRLTGSGEPCVHLVRRGESIDRIAARYGTTRGALVTANDLRRPDGLRAGQRLEVPGCDRGRRVPAPASSSDVARDFASAQARSARAPSRPVPGYRSHPWRGEFIWPVEGPVSSGFGRRGFWGWHSGVDITAQQGRPIRAAAPGTVLFSGWQSSYGRVVKIAHGNGFTTVYAHNLKNSVKAGDRVEAGTVIGAVGRTGHATANHLHFEVLRQGRAQNPMAFLERRQPTRMLAKAD